MKSALIVIDVQNYFAVEKAANLPEKIATHIKNNLYDCIMFTKFRNDPSSNFHKILHWKKATERPAIDLHPALAQFATSENTFDKTTYSAFKSLEFVDYLKQHRITDLFVCGINIDGCVLATTYEAFDLGYKVKILEELSSVASFREDRERVSFLEHCGF